MNSEKRICNSKDSVSKSELESLRSIATAYDRILRVARTIADFQNAHAIGTEHVAEAIQYRSLDRQIWS